MQADKSNSVSFKKCENCGKISKWNLSDNDRCEHCDAFLVSRELIIKREKAIEEEKEDFLVRWEFTEIKEDDSIYTMFFKNIAWRIQLILTAILSFFIWLIASAAG
jgi:hypothetical protein